jgi:hypothetical protein
VLSRDVQFIIEISSGKIRIWSDGINGLEPMTFSGSDYIAAPWTGTQVSQVRWAQYYDQMIFVQKNHKMRVLRYLSGNFTFGEFDIITDLVKYGKGSDYFGMREDGYPSVIAICQNRLYLANTAAEPHTVWISRVYSDEGGLSDFSTYDIVTDEQEILSDPSTWPLKPEEDEDGNVVTDENGDIVYTDQYDFSDPSKLKTTVTNEDEVVTAECAMKIQLNSGRNDAIRWISSFDNIYIGTDGSEWMLPYSINALDQSASRVSSFGSSEAGSDSLSSGLLFVKKGGMVEEITVSSSGMAINDLTYTADHISSSGVSGITCLGSPMPMVILSLSDGTIGVCTYDARYQIQGWSHWETGGDISSLCVIDGNIHERLIAVVADEIGSGLYEFDFDETQSYSDDTFGEYASYLVTNRWDISTDSGVTLGRTKTISQMILRCLDSGKARIGYKDGYMQETEFDSSDVSVPISGGADKELRLRIESVGDYPLDVLALAFDMGVN